MTLSDRGKKTKNSLFEPRQTPSAKIEHVGVYFAKMGCKIKGGFTDILGFQSWYIVFGRRGVLLALNNLRSIYKFCSQMKKRQEPFSHGVVIFFFPYFDFTLMNVYMDTGIK